MDVFRGRAQVVDIWVFSHEEHRVIGLYGSQETNELHGHGGLGIR